MEIRCLFDNILEKVRCEVKSITGPSNRIESVVGNYPEGKNNEDVVNFFVQNTNLEAFPENLHRLFPNLTILTVDKCGLKKITRNDLIGFDTLESLTLSNNDLTTLPDDLFVGMKNLKHVHFNNNKLENLSSKLLKPVEGTIMYANFQNNFNIDDLYVQRYSGNLTELMKKMDQASPAIKSQAGAFPKNMDPNSLPPTPKPRGKLEES